MRSVSIQALGTRCRIQFRCADQAAALKFMGAAAAWLGAFERKCSRISDDAGSERAETDPEMEDVRKAANNAFNLTQGMSLSLDALSRQYAVDRLVQLLRQHGIQDALVQAGGDVFALGNDGVNPFWKVGLEHGIQTPDGTVLMLSNEAVCCARMDDTSVDSRTGRPPRRDLRAVTVVASTCLTAGVHAASMLVLGQDEGLRFAESTGMANACLLGETGTFVMTRGFSEYQHPSGKPASNEDRPVPLTQPKAVKRWLSRDLIRLWPWMLPVVLLLITFGPAGFRHSGTQPEAAGAALGMVWMTFLITRRLWGHYRAHAAATMLMFTLGLFAIGWLPMPDMTLCFLNLAAIAALVHQRAWTFFILLGLGTLLKGPIAALVPASAALGWWLAGGMTAARTWLAGSGLTLALGVASVVWKGTPVAALTEADLPAALARPWWHFLPLLFLALMPWSLCTPRVVRQGWRRLRTGTLRARHGMLAGWLLPALCLMPGSLSVSALLLVPALIIAFCPPLADARRLWKMGSATLALWLTAGFVSATLHHSSPSPASPQLVKQKETVHEATFVAHHGQIAVPNPLLPVSHTPSGPTKR